MSNIELAAKTATVAKISRENKGLRKRVYFAIYAPRRLCTSYILTVEKPKPKQLLRPITIGTNSSMNQSQFLAITCNSPEAREKSRAHGAIGFGVASHWLKNWREFFKPITKRSNRDHVITFDSHLKTALL